MIKRAVWLAPLYLALAGASLQAGNLLLGDPPKLNTGNCDPFGCPGFFGLGTYQQVYSATAFPGIMSIDSLTFFQSQVLGNGGQPADGTYTLTFSYSPEAPGFLALTDANANIGSGSLPFFTGALPALTAGNGENLLSLGGTPFLYNPAIGNLLLTVSVTGAKDPNFLLYMDESQCGPQTVCPVGYSVVSSNAFFGSYKGQPLSGGNTLGGLITDFTYSPGLNLSTPEPGSLFLVLAGIGLIGYQGRRRHNH